MSSDDFTNTHTAVPGETGAGVKSPNEQVGSRRDPEERPVSQQDKKSLREKMLDKTLADSFPISDPRVFPIRVSTIRS
jgi:hypothetical protein